MSNACQWRTQAEAVPSMAGRRLLRGTIHISARLTSATTVPIAPKRYAALRSFSAIHRPTSRRRLYARLGNASRNFSSFITPALSSSVTLKLASMAPLLLAYAHSAARTISAMRFQAKIALPIRGRYEDSDFCIGRHHFPSGKPENPVTPYGFPERLLAAVAALRHAYLPEPWRRKVMRMPRSSHPFQSSHLTPTPVSYTHLTLPTSDLV